MSSANLLLLAPVNLPPRAGVLLCDWAVDGLMVLYRAGDLVPGFYTLLKMLTKLPGTCPCTGGSTASLPVPGQAGR